MCLISHLSAWQLARHIIIDTKQYITIMIVIYHEDKIGPCSLPSAVGSVPPVYCPGLLKGAAKFGCYCYFNYLILTEHWDCKALAGAQKEVGAAPPTLSWAGSVGLAAYVAENRTAKKDHLDQCSEGSWETCGASD